MLSQSKITYLVLLLIAFLTLPAFAQGADTIIPSSFPSRRNRITFAPLGLVNKIRFRYERTLNKTACIGIEPSIYHKDPKYPGVQIPILYKQFLVKPEKFINTTQLSGVYFMAQCGFAYHRYTAYDDIQSKTTNSLILSFTDYYAEKVFTVESYGLMYGLFVGYQGFIDCKKRWNFETYIGVKQFLFDKDPNSYYSKKQSIIPDMSNLFDYNPYAKNQFNDNLSPGSNLVIGINLGFNF